MTCKYIIRSRMTRWSDELGRDVQGDAITVYEPDHEPRYTGLLDSNGNELVAVEEKRPIGFDTTGAR